MSDPVEFFTHPDQFPADVVEMFRAHERVDMEFGIDWFRNLINTVYKDLPTVHFGVLRQSGKPVAVLPLLIAAEEGLLRASGLANFYTAVYSPLFDPSVTAPQVAQLLKAVIRQHPRIAEFRFSPMGPDSHSFKLLQAALKLGGLRPFSFFCFGNWYLAANETWEEYLLSRSRTLRNTIRRMDKKFLADGGTLELVQGPENLAQAIADYESVYAASWKNEEPYPEFVPGLIRFCAENGWLRLGIAKIEGRPIAAQLWIVSHGRAKIYKVAYREEYKSYSPGTLVSAMLMENILDSKAVSEVDFLIGDDAYKQSWMSHRRERWGLIAYNPRTLRGAYGLVRESVWRLVKPLYSKLQSRLRKPGKIEKADKAAAA